VELEIEFPTDSCEFYDSCDCSAEMFYVYYSHPEQELELVDSVAYYQGDTLTYYLYDQLDYVVGCFGVSAVDSLGNESELSNIICLDYDACPPYVIPNVFTPNNDSYNDFLVPESYANIERIDLKIFNRWGKIMYETQDPEIKWDGKNQENGQDCPAAPYFYVGDVYFVTLDGVKQTTVQGSVTIVR
jgi:gliding motility-associated-like protein